MHILPVIGGKGIVIAPSSSGGGSSTPGLPVFTYTSGMLASGKLTTDNSELGSTSVITISDTAKNGGMFTWALGIAPGMVLIFTNSEGVSNAFSVATVTGILGGTEFSVGVLGGSGSWSGDYQLSFSVNAIGTAAFTAATDYATAVQGTAADAAAAAAIPADTGWTANADGGDKTSVIPANATLDAMQAALNLVVAGFGDAFVAVADKTKAIESALAAQVRPNA